MKQTLLLISCMVILCTNAFGADCISASNLCYTNITRKDGTIIRRGYYYPNGYGTSVYVDSVTVQGCADGYYMPTNAPRPKCTGGATTINAIAIDECCWPCPFLDQEESYQECYHIIYGTDAYVSQCDLEWCRGSVSGKDPYGGITTCLLTIEDKDNLPVGSDKTGNWIMNGACQFTGSQQNIDNQCNCYPRTDYETQYCAD